MLTKDQFADIEIKITVSASGECNIEQHIEDRLDTAVHMKIVRILNTACDTVTDLLKSGYERDDDE